MPVVALGSPSKSVRKATPATLKRLLVNKPQSLGVGDLKSLKGVLSNKQYKKLVNLGKNFSDEDFDVNRSGNTIRLSRGSKKLELEMIFAKQEILTKFNGKLYNLNKEKDFERALRDIRITFLKKKNKSASFFSNPVNFLSLVFINTYEAEAMGGWFFMGGMAALGIGIALGLSKLGKSLKNTKHEVVASGTVKGDVDVSGNVTADANIKTENQVNVDGKVLVDTNGDGIVNSLDSMAEEIKTKDFITVPASTGKSLD